MRISLFFFCFLVQSINCLSQSTSSDTDLAKTENLFFEALRTRSFTGFDNLYDASFSGTLASGKVVNKEEILEYQKTSDSFIIKSFEELKVRIYGDVALSTGIEVNKTKSGTKVGQLRFLRIWIKKDNQWKVIESQYTAIIG